VNAAEPPWLETIANLLPTHFAFHGLRAAIFLGRDWATDALALLAGLTDRPNLLVVLDRSDLVSLKSVRNLADVHVLAVDQLNTYDVLCADDIVFTQAALDAFVAGPVKADKAAAKEDAK